MWHATSPNLDRSIDWLTCLEPLLKNGGHDEHGFYSNRSNRRLVGNRHLHRHGVGSILPMDVPTSLNHLASTTTNRIH